MRLRTIYNSLLAGAICIGVTGCASTGRRTFAPAARPLGAQYVSAGQDTHKAKDTVTSEPTDALLIKQALALALLRNPGLEAFSHEVRVTEALAIQARALPNPMIELEVEEYDRDGEGYNSSETVVALSQVLELGGKRRWRTRIAESKGELAGWDYESKRLDVFTSTIQRFVDVIAAQRRVDLAKSSVELAEKTEQAVGERAKAGKEPPFQVAKAAAELEMTRIGLSEAVNGLAVSRLKLASMWGDTDPRFRTVQGDFDFILEAIPPLRALSSYLSRNPDLARLDAELQLSMAGLSSQKAARIPDIKAEIGFLSYEEDGTDALAFGVKTGLPVFNRNSGNIAAAEHQLAKAKALRRGTEMALSTRLAEAHATLTAAQKKAETLKSKVVPAIQKAFDAAHEGYRQGKFDFLDMLDAQRSLFEAKGALVDALSSYHAAIAEIQRLTGTSIEEMTSQQRKE
ncbi:MAG: TolC family protein [Kiritimatiellia bacterium]|nr:TolC family protein [Kiritimatiellia bacterium]